MDFKAIVIGSVPVEGEGRSIYEVLIEHLDGKDNIGNYPRTFIANDEDDLKQQVRDEIEMIKSNLPPAANDDPLVGTTLSL